MLGVPYLIYSEELGSSEGDYHAAAGGREIEEQARRR